MTATRCRAALALTLGLVVAVTGLVGCTNQPQPHPKGTAVTRTPGQPVPPAANLADVTGLDGIQAWFAAAQGTPRLVLALSPT